MNTARVVLPFTAWMVGFWQAGLAREARNAGEEFIAEAERRYACCSWSAVTVAGASPRSETSGFFHFGEGCEVARPSNATRSLGEFADGKGAICAMSDEIGRRAAAAKAVMFMRSFTALKPCPSQGVGGHGRMNESRTEPTGSIDRFTAGSFLRVSPRPRDDVSKAAAGDAVNGTGGYSFLTC